MEKESLDYDYDWNGRVEKETSKGMCVVISLNDERTVFLLCSHQDIINWKTLRSHHIDHLIIFTSTRLYFQFLSLYISTQPLTNNMSSKIVFVLFYNPHFDYAAHELNRINLPYSTKLLGVRIPTTKYHLEIRHSSSRFLHLSLCREWHKATWMRFCPSA